MIKSRVGQWSLKRGKGRFILFICCMFTLFVCGSAGAFKLPDTGQTTCYDQVGNVISCPAPGQPLAQDGSYNINPLSYTDNGDGTVTDNNTGLMWQKEDDGIFYNWYKASGTFNASYNNPPSQSVCGSLTLGGHSDWRLPTKRELMSIVNYGISISYPSPTIDPVFSNTKAFYYWSSNTCPNCYGADYAWWVRFYYGDVGFLDKGTNMYVRCVRGEQPQQHFTDNGNGTVTDNGTGLMWQQGVPEPDMLWDSALSYCEGLSLGGHSDWRLPNIKELESLTEDTTYWYPAIDTNFFPQEPTASYRWVYSSSTTRANDPFIAVSVVFESGSVWGYCGKDNSFCYVRCVRSGEGEPPPACTYTYSDWGDCQSDNTQTRTVLSSSPANCVGTPVLSQSCIYVPPSDGSSILITKYAMKSQINSGAQAIFDITIENNGETPLVNIEMKDDQCDELKADKNNNNNYLAIGDKLKYTCIKKYVTRDLTNIAAVKAISINGTVVTSSAIATVKVDNGLECDPSLYENICDKKGQVVTGFYIIAKKERKEYDCNYGDPDIVVIDKQVMPNGDIKCIEQGIVGNINSDCLGRCGPGCGWDLFDERYTQECLNHDLCTRSTGKYLGPCKTEFDIAQEGWTCAEECPE